MHGRARSEIKSAFSEVRYLRGFVLMFPVLEDDGMKTSRPQVEFEEFCLMRCLHMHEIFSSIRQVFAGAVTLEVQYSGRNCCN